MHLLTGEIWRKIQWGLMLSLASAVSVQAATITGYQASEHDRFASGFPTASVANTHDDFVGIKYDWSGVGWSTTTYSSSSYKGLGMLSPVHFLTAQHYEGGSNRTQGLRVLGQDGLVHTQTVSIISATACASTVPTIWPLDGCRHPWVPQLR